MEISVARRQCVKLVEKWGFSLSKKEVLETRGRYVSENKIPTPFREGVPGDVPSASKECIS